MSQNMLQKMHSKSTRWRSLEGASKSFSKQKAADCSACYKSCHDNYAPQMTFNYSN